MRHAVSFRAMLARWQKGATLSSLAMALVACAGGSRPSTAPKPAPGSPPVTGSAAAGGSAGSPAAAPLPTIAHVTGPVTISVVYPHPDAVIETRDSNFILGSVGTGDATLMINGYAVPVEPNGAFLAWLPVPDSTKPRYDLVAVVGPDTSRLSYPIRLLPSRAAQADSAAASAASTLDQPFPDSGRFVMLAARDSTLPDTDRFVIGRPIPGGTYKWFLLPGTLLEVTGRSPGYERVRLDDALDILDLDDGHPSTSDLPRPAIATHIVCSW